MKPKETPLDNLFQEFQSEFRKATTKEQSIWAVSLRDWAQQQIATLQEANTGSQDLQSLVESEIHLRQMAENIEQVFWVRDLRNDRILYVSPAYETVWGRSCESLYADPHSFIESVHPEDRLQVLVARTYDNPRLFTQEYRIVRPDGSLRWILARTFKLREETGQPYRLVSFAQDITEQKKVELALRKTLDRTREQFTLSRKMSLARKPEAVLKALMSAYELRSAQRAALLFFENPEAGPIHGLELKASWLSSHTLPAWLSELRLYDEPALRELFQPNHPVVFPSTQTDPRLSPMIRDHLLEGNIHSLVIFPLFASGVWLGCLCVFFEHEHDFNKSELRHLKVLVDQATITLYNLQLLEVEEELRWEAEQANEIKIRFLAMISHELRTPLTSIKGFIDTLLAEDVAWEPHEQRDFLYTIQRETNRLEDLIDHLLDLTRLEAGMLPISLAPHSLYHIIEDVLPQFNALTRGQELLLRLPVELPLVLVDEKRIAQVLVNLVRNASAYAPEGTQITISACLLGGFVQVDVTDQGPGIPSAERKRVFEAFRRGEREENSPVRGAGLGLAICKGLVEAQGGRIWVKKNSTPGATLSFTIPLAPVQSLAVLPEEGN